MSKRTNHKLLAMTALVSAFAVGSTAQAANTSVAVSSAVSPAIVTELELAVDADTSGTATAGDTVATEAGLSAEMGDGDNTGTVIDVDLDVTLNVGHDVQTTGAGGAAIDVTAASGAAASTTINVASGVTVDSAGAADAISVQAGQVANIVLDGATVTSTGGNAIGFATTTAAAAAITVSGSTVGDIQLSDNDDTVTVTGTSTLAAVMGTGTGSNTLTSTGATTAASDITDVAAINITGGTFDLNADIVTGGSVTISTGAELDLAGATAIAADVTIASGSTLTTVIGAVITGDVTVADTGVVDGALTLGGGAETLTLGNSTVTGALAGGAGADVLNITPGAGNTVALPGAVSAFTDINLGAGTVDLNSTIAGATTLDIASGGTLDAAGSTSIAATTLTVAAGGTLNVSGTGGSTLAGTALNVSGTLTADADAELQFTDVRIADDATLNAEEVTLDTGGASTLTLENSGTAVTYATSITGAGGDDELLIDGDDKLVTLSGTITGSDITLDASSTVAMTGATANTAVALTLGADSSLRVQGANLTASGAFTTGAGSSIRVDAGNRLTAATSAWDADTTWNMGLSWNEASATASVAGVSLTGAAVDLTDHTVNIMLAPGSDVVSSTADSGATLTLFQGNAGATISTTIVDTAFYDFGLTVAGNNVNLDVTQTVSSFGALGSTSANSAALTALQGLDGTASAALQTIYSGVVGQTTTAGVNNAVESLLPDMSGGAVAAAINTAVGAGGSVSTRLASLRGTESGMAAGDMTANRGMWVQAFGTTVDQDERSGIKGYDATTAGLAVGVDSDEVMEGARVGVALSYASSDVDSDASSNAQTDIDSYQLTAYGSKDLAGDRFVDAMVGYAVNSYSTARTDFLGNGYNGDFDGNQFMLKAAAGQTMDRGSMKVTPTVGFNYVYVDTDSYSETGAGGGALRVDSDSNAALFLTAGADLSWEKQGANGTMYTPYLSAALSYDIIGDEVEATSTFLGGGAAFNTKGADVAQAALDLGAGVNVVTTDDLEINLGYDATIKSDYLAHTGQVRFRWMF